MARGVLITASSGETRNAPTLVASNAPVVAEKHEEEAECEYDKMLAAMAVFFICLVALLFIITAGGGWLPGLHAVLLLIGVTTVGGKATGGVPIGVPITWQTHLITGGFALLGMLALGVALTEARECDVIRKAHAKAAAAGDG